MPTTGLVAPRRVHHRLGIAAKTALDALVAELDDRKVSIDLDDRKVLIELDDRKVLIELDDRKVHRRRVCQAVVDRTSSSETP